MESDRTKWSYSGIMSLNSPNLVAKIQSMCGIEWPEYEPKSNGHVQCNGAVVQNGNCENGYILHSSSDSNGLANGEVANGGHSNLSNGHTWSTVASSSLRSRQAPPSPAKSIYGNGHETSAIPNGIHSVQTTEPPESTTDFIVASKFFFYLFHLGAGLGNEIVYSILWPSLVWHLDAKIARSVCLTWFVAIYLGQAMKEVICWPRPSSPPVAQLEDRYSLEFGMPSTHAVVGVTIPCAILYFVAEKYEVNWCWAIVFFIAWCPMTCFSRIYLGMHSVLDVVCGMAFGAFMLVLLPIIPYVDYLYIHHWTGYGLILGTAGLFSWFYPELTHWNTSRGDSYAAVAVTFGLVLGCRFNFLRGAYVDAAPPLVTTLFSAEKCAGLLVQTVLGLVLLLITRQLAKTCIIRLLCAIYKFDRKDPVSWRVNKFELPCKLTVYTAIALSVTIFIPMVFDQFGMSRTIYRNEY